MGSTNNNIEVGVLPLPDGVTGDGDLRISLIFSPSENVSITFLRDWPTKVAEQCANLKVQFLGADSKSLQGDSVVVNVKNMNGKASDASALWTKLFSFEEDLTNLKNALAPSKPKDELTYSAIKKKAEENVALQGYSEINKEKTSDYNGAAILATHSALRQAVMSATLQANYGKSANLTSANNETPFRYIFATRLLNILSNSSAGMDAEVPSVQLYLNGKKDKLVSVRTLTDQLMQMRRNKQTSFQPGRERLLQAIGNVTFLHPTTKDAITQLNQARCAFSETKCALHEHVENFLLSGTLLTGENPMKGDWETIRSFMAPSNASAEEKNTLVIGLVVSVINDKFFSTFGYAQSKPVPNTYRILDAEKEQDIQAKFGSIRSSPTLGKMLNFIVDVTVSLPGNMPENGFVRVGFSTENFDGSPTVAFKYVEKSIFRPASISDFGNQFKAGKRKKENEDELKKCIEAQGLPLKNGIVNLGGPRFTLATNDVHVAVNASRLQWTEAREAQLNGADVDTISPRLAEERGRGIQLFDNDSHQMVMAKLTLDEDAGTNGPFYAEDLVLGYRVFVKRKGKDWRTLMARSVRFEGIDDHYGDWSPYEDAGEREHGYIRLAPRIEKIAGSSDELPDGKAIASSQIFTWLGDSLGMPAPQKYKCLTDIEKAHETARIGIETTIDYANEFPAPALRCGSEYEFGLVPVYLQGAGPTLKQFAEAVRPKKDAEAKNKSIVEKLTIGEDGSTLPFLYGRPNDVHAPSLLVAIDDPLFSKSSENEVIDRLVLKSRSSENRHSIKRFFVPPRVDFEHAEQFGMFDQMEGRPSGAFEQFALDVQTGEFLGLDQKVAAKNGKKRTIATIQKNEGRLLPKRPYFPDPMARNLRIAFERDGKLIKYNVDNVTVTGTSKGESSSVSREFWMLGENPEQCLSALPVELKISCGDSTKIIEEKRVGDFGGQAITLEIAPAEEVTIWAWCWPDLETLCRLRRPMHDLMARVISLNYSAPKGSKKADQDNFLEMNYDNRFDFLMTYFRALATTNSAPAALEVIKKEHSNFNISYMSMMREVLEEKLFHSVPFNGVSGWRKLRLVHAVERPLGIPTISNTKGFAFRKRSDTPFPVNYSDNLDEPGGTKVYFSGSLKFDRASTRAIRVEANWPILDYEHAVQKVPAIDRNHRETFIDNPPRADQVLFELRDIPRDYGANSKSDIDLFKDELGNKRELLAQFGQVGFSATAACRLHLRIVATSRFSDEFAPDDPKREIHELGKFEVETRPSYQKGNIYKGDCGVWRVERKVDAKVEGAVDISILLPATVRPPIPVVTRIDWILPEQKWPATGAPKFYRKSCYPRLYLDNSFRASGPDELIAVLFPVGACSDEEKIFFINSESVEKYPDDEYKRNQISVHLPAGKLPENFVTSGEKIADALLGVSKSSDCSSCEYVTRWGQDPTARLGSAMTISPCSFSGYIRGLARQKLPRPSNAIDAKFVLVEKEKNYLDVDILLYKPQLDKNTGEWYIDIGIEPGAAYAPFVELALARYQPDALEDLYLSVPLVLDPIQIQNPRLVEINRTDSVNVEVNVYGVVYTSRTPLPDPDKVTFEKGVKELIQQPLQKFEFMRKSLRSPYAPIRHMNDLEKKIEFKSVIPTSWNDASKSGLWKWSKQFNLDQECTVVVINEVDMQLPDDFIGIIKDDGTPKEIAAKDLIERPGNFTMTIEVGQLNK